MANKIKPKRSYTSNAVPTTSELDVNELAINWADGKAYTKNAAGNIVSVTLGGGGGGGGSGLQWSSVPASATATGTAGQIAYDDATGFFYVATATNTWKRTALSTWVPFGPTAIAGLQAWYDASDASTLYDATVGGSLVAADGAVARWQDKSGNARHATQAESANRPLRKAAIRNGRDGLAFDGTDDFFEISSAQNLDGDFTLFFALRPTGSQYALLAGTSYNTGRFLLIGGTLYNDRYGASALALPTSATINQSIRRSYSRASGTLRCWLDSSLQGSGSFSAAGNHTQIGKIHDQSTFFLAGELHEIIIYNTALSDTDRAAVENYLIGKWGIS